MKSMMTVSKSLLLFAKVEAMIATERNTQCEQWCPITMRSYLASSSSQTKLMV